MMNAATSAKVMLPHMPFSSDISEGYKGEMASKGGQWVCKQCYCPSEDPGM